MTTFFQKPYSVVPSEAKENIYGYMVVQRVQTFSGFDYMICLGDLPVNLGKCDGLNWGVEKPLEEEYTLDDNGYYRDSEHNMHLHKEIDEEIKTMMRLKDSLYGKSTKPADLQLMKFVIPKGSRYLTGYNGSNILYAAEKIDFVERVHYIRTPLILG